MRTGANLTREAEALTLELGGRVWSHVEEESGSYGLRYTKMERLWVMAGVRNRIADAPARIARDADEITRRGVR